MPPHHEEAPSLPPDTLVERPGAKRICELDGLRSLLEQSLAQDYPVSVRRIATQLGYAGGNGGFIHRSFPDLCRSIAVKRKAWDERRMEDFRHAVGAAILEQPPPTLYELSQRLGFQTSTTLRFWAPDMAERLIKSARNIQRKRLQDFDWC